MRATLTALLCLTGCAGVEDPVPPTPASITRQAATVTFGDGGVRVKGNGMFAHLGSTIASCPGGGYVAGAPGDDSVWLSPVQARLVTPRSFLFEVEPFPVVCLGATANVLRVLVGGPTAYSLRPDGGSQISGQRIDAFDATPGAWLAVGRAVPGNVSLFPSTAAGLTSPTFTSTPAVAGQGTSVAWNQGGALLVGNPQARTAGLYLPDVNADGGVLLIAPFTLANPEPGLAASDFGMVVATGDVTPDFSEEHLIAAPAVGRVYIFSGIANVMTLRGGASFGAALAIDPRDLGGGLHAIWVGEPAANRVHRFVGTGGQAFDAPGAAANNSQFGAALTVDAQGVLAVGAPKYSDGVLLELGAVFEATVDAGTLAGLAMHCNAGQGCTLPGCTTGTCLGAVFCERTRAAGSDCSATERCVMNTCVDGGVADAGSTDAGATDAGATDAGSTDAGSTDAGSMDGGAMDAGAPDAGPVDAGPTDGGADAGVGSDAGSFADGGATDAGGEPLDAGQEPLVYRTSSCGCSSGEVPLLVLGLALRRRKRGQRSG
jgi:hypothetical protein